MNLNQLIKEQIQSAFHSLFQHDLSLDQITLQPTRKEFEGSHTLVTFSFARVTKQSPEQTGQSIGQFLLDQQGIFKSFNVVKGFLNLELNDRVWVDALKGLFETEAIGVHPPKGQRVMVEFSSPNTNKPLHLGHLRNNFLGDSVSRILTAAGYEVKRTNLVNDRGIHICKSMLAYVRFGAGEDPTSAGIKGDHLAGKYYVKFDQELKKEIALLVNDGMSAEEAGKKAPLMIAAQEMLKKWEAKDTDTVALWSKMNGWVYDGFNHTYQTMGIEFDAIYHESETYLLGKDVIDEGLDKEVFFRKDDRSVWIDLSGEGLDEKLVLRGDGTSVYMTQDIGTCDFKYADFPMDKSVYVVGNEQDYHFKVLFKIMQKLGRTYSEGLYHLSYGMVDLPSGKMKSREGTVVDADDLMQEMFDTAERHTRELGKIDGMPEEEANTLFKTIGLGALKYFLLKVDPKKRMLFDPQESIEFQGHTGPFIQYTHARISAILRRGEQFGKAINVGGEVFALHPREAVLIQTLNKFGDVVASSAADFSPAILAQYVYDVSKDYNGFYQEVSIFNEDDDAKLSFRLALSKVTASVLKSGMRMLGIHVPDRM